VERERIVVEVQPTTRSQVDISGEESRVRAMVVVGVPRETYPGERRVAVIPAQITHFKKAGLDVIVERGAGESAGFPDSEYEAREATLASRDEVFKKADCVLQVRGFGANQEAGAADLERYREGQISVAVFEPLDSPEAVQKLAARKISAFSMELIPRITRAQSMDVLSSMATSAGYKAVLLAADALPRIFPMLMTAAGTLAPARVFVVGVGVAGLQALATAKRLGAVCEAYDVRPAVKDQVQSVGAKFVEFDLETEDLEDKGGYAKEQSEDFIRRQQEQMAAVLARHDVVITTAAIPGKKAPVLVTDEMLEGMAPGSVIVDLAAERGGNCSATVSGESVVAHGVTVIGPENLPSSTPYHASQMYSKNIKDFVLNMVKDGKIEMDMEDEIVAETLLTRNGEIHNARVRDLLGLSSEAAEIGSGT
jgi:NAD(P) transhydrogenase subunit alpha